MHILRPLVLKGMFHNIHFKASHVDGISNCFADSVFRQEWSQFRRLARLADDSFHYRNHS